MSSKDIPPPYDMQPAAQQQYYSDNTLQQQPVQYIPQQQPVPQYIPQQQPVQYIPQQQPVQYAPQQPAPVQQGPSTNVVIMTQPAATNPVTIVKTKDHYYTLSTIMTFMCVMCGTWIALFCTVPAMIFSSLAKKAEAKGDLSAAKLYGRLSLALNIAAVVTYFVIIIMIIISVSVSATSSSSSSYRSGYYNSYYGRYYGK